MLTTNIILMAGLPASGKSQFVQKYKDLGYVILSLDAKTMSYASNRKVFIDFAIHYF